MKIISYDGSMQEKSSMSVLLENDIKTEIIEHGKKTRPSQKNKGTDKANSIEMINLVRLSVDDYLDSAPSSVNPIHDEEHTFREMNV